jgi:hypothetical protein
MSKTTKIEKINYRVAKKKYGINKKKLKAKEVKKIK